MKKDKGHTIKKFVIKMVAIAAVSLGFGSLGNASDAEARTRLVSSDSFEIDGVPEEVAQEALRLAAQKLPLLCKFVVRPDYDGK